MANERLSRVDLCRGFRIARRQNLGAPLDAVIPAGIAAAGCRPVLTHHQAANDAILSRINQANAGYIEALLTSAAETIAFPDVTPGIAAVPQSVLTGSTTLPYPTDPLGYEVIFFTNTYPHFRSIVGLSPTSVGTFINADGRSESVMGGNTGMWRDLLLGGNQQFVSSFFAPYHSYNYGGIYILCPNQESSIVQWTGTEYRWPQASLGAGRSTSRQVDPMQPFSQPSYNVHLRIWEAEPCWDGGITGELAEPIALGTLNGPSLGRKLVHHQFATNATMPGYGGAFTDQHSITGARSNLIIWCDENIDSVELNGDPGTLYSSTPTPEIRAAELFIPADEEVRIFPRAFQYSIDPLEVEFAVKWFAFSGEEFDQTMNPFEFSLLDTIPRWYEGYAIAYIEE